MKFRKTWQEKQKGFTLIEALVVMIVGIVILATAAAGIGKLFRSSEVSTEAENIMQIATNVRNLRNGANSYKGLDTAAAIRFKAIPATMTQDPNGRISNIWGGMVAVQSVENDRRFIIVYLGVPSEACQQLTLKLRNADWSRVMAAGAQIEPDTSLSAIAAACNSAGSVGIDFVSSS